MEPGFFVSAVPGPAFPPPVVSAAEELLWFQIFLIQVAAEDERVLVLWVVAVLPAEGPEEAVEILLREGAGLPASPLVRQ